MQKVMLCGYLCEDPVKNAMASILIAGFILLGLLHFFIVHEFHIECPTGVRWEMSVVW